MSIHLKKTRSLCVISWHRPTRNPLRHKNNNNYLTLTFKENVDCVINGILALSWYTLMEPTLVAPTAPMAKKPCSHVPTYTALSFRVKSPCTLRAMNSLTLSRSPTQVTAATIRSQHQKQSGHLSQVSTTTIRSPTQVTTSTIRSPITGLNNNNQVTYHRSQHQQSGHLHRSQQQQSGHLHRSQQQQSGHMLSSANTHTHKTHDTQ